MDYEQCYYNDFSPAHRNEIESDIKEKFENGISNKFVRKALICRTATSLKESINIAMRLQSRMDQMIQPNEIICNYCNKRGHKEVECRTKQCRIKISNETADHYCEYDMNFHQNNSYNQIYDSYNSRYTKNTKNYNNYNYEHNRSHFQNSILNDQHNCNQFYKLHEEQHLNFNRSGGNFDQNSDNIYNNKSFNGKEIKSIGKVNKCMEGAHLNAINEIITSKNSYNIMNIGNITESHTQSSRAHMNEKDNLVTESNQNINKSLTQRSRAQNTNKNNIEEKNGNRTIDVKNVSETSKNREEVSSRSKHQNSQMEIRGLNSL